MGGIKDRGRVGVELEGGETQGGRGDGGREE
jgi:hypothetical protein